MLSGLFYSEEIVFCENIINEWSSFINNKREEIEKMPFDEFISLPELICTSEYGFTITRKE